MGVKVSIECSDVLASMIHWDFEFFNISIYGFFFFWDGDCDGSNNLSIWLGSWESAKSSNPKETTQINK